MKKIIFIGLAFLLPVVVSAQGGQFTDTFMLIVSTKLLVDRSIILVAAIALLVFFWGLVKYIRKAGEGDVKEGRDLMVWGTIALFVMVSVWGLVRFIQGELLPGENFGDVTIPGFK
jgi:hypothetical protein